MLHGEVKVWYMTEEERLAYIKKHPIKPTKRNKKEVHLKDMGRKKRKKSPL
ncbi:hypothetical protein [Bacillus sp. B-jedd]|uniref:hypothetical protein n=1 Tax=Bacillus sp. B-jedd TaxID=1476857 RepID=UPI00051555E3|nr:hypothetical protein [Bacillus sp. B-jedd]CEG28095.1 hypothetical protein BN1002_02974 [Bacillus sp. B-jedd]